MVEESVRQIGMIGFFIIIGATIFMFFLLAIVEAICDYKLRRHNETSTFKPQ